MRLWQYLKNYKSKIIIGPAFKLLETLTDILTPWLVALILDIGVANNDAAYIWGMSGVVLAINILGVVFAIICQKCSALTSEGVGRDLRRKMYKHINTFSNAEMDKYTTMSLTNRVVNDVDQIQTAIGLTIRQVTRAPFLLLGCSFMAMLIDVRLSIIFLILTPILALVMAIVMKKTLPLHIESKKRLDTVSNVTRESLSGVRVVRAFNKQDNENARFGKVNDRYTDNNILVGNISAIMHPIMFALINIAVVVILWQGGIRVNIGKLSSGNVIAFINYFGQISMAVLMIARIIITYTRSGASLKRIYEVLDTKNTLVNPDKPIVISDKIDGSVEFVNVSFSYNDVKNAVNGLSIKIASGQTVGIIGGTGSGKSSVINLIPRLYDASKGIVKVGGYNVKRYNMKDLRSLIGFVPQNPTLFKGTIRENMQVRKSDATDEEIARALIIAQAYEFVKATPDYLDSKVERGGTNFSGGQKQRLTIARALVGGPKILILDDSSSALDYATDAALRRAIGRSMSGITTIIVSQRANSIRHADLIVCMDNGNVVGVGRHEDLMKSCAVYQEIYSSQNKQGVK